MRVVLPTDNKISKGNNGPQDFGLWSGQSRLSSLRELAKSYLQPAHSSGYAGFSFYALEKCHIMPRFGAGSEATNDLFAP